MLISLQELMELLENAKAQLSMNSYGAYKDGVEDAIHLIKELVGDWKETEGGQIAGSLDK